MSNQQASKSEIAVARVPNERLEDLFSDAVRERVAGQDCDLVLQEFDVAIVKEVGRPICINVTVYGSAGDTPKDAFLVKGKVVKGGGSFQVKLDDDSVVKFVFDSITNLNATDYLVTYKLA